MSSKSKKPLNEVREMSKPVPPEQAPDWTVGLYTSQEIAETLSARFGVAVTPTNVRTRYATEVKQAVGTHRVTVSLRYTEFALHLMCDLHQRVKAGEMKRSDWIAETAEKYEETVETESGQGFTPSQDDVIDAVFEDDISDEAVGAIETLQQAQDVGIAGLERNLTAQEDRIAVKLFQLQKLNQTERDQQITSKTVRTDKVRADAMEAELDEQLVKKQAQAEAREMLRQNGVID